MVRAVLIASFNDAAFDSIDYAIYAAKLYGLRVIVPLTDQYQYYRAHVLSLQPSLTTRADGGATRSGYARR